MKKWKVLIWDYSTSGWRTLKENGDLHGDKDRLFNSEDEARSAVNPFHRFKIIETTPRPS